MDLCILHLVAIPVKKFLPAFLFFGAPFLIPILILPLC